MQHATLSGSWRGRERRRERERDSEADRDGYLDSCSGKFRIWKWVNKCFGICYAYAACCRWHASETWVSDWRVREMERQRARQRVDATFCWLISLSATSGWLNKCQARAKDKHNQAHTHIQRRHPSHPTQATQTVTFMRSRTHMQIQAADVTQWEALEILMHGEEHSQRHIYILAQCQLCL